MTAAGGRGRLVLVGAGVAALLALGLLALGWRLSGGRWQNVQTPSMGQAAPVGTLVLTRPVRIAALNRGDIITYRPPVRGLAPHTHRVVSVAPGSPSTWVTTRGDINGAADPWRIRQSDLVGVVVARLWGVGWVIRMLPALVGGVLVVFVATRFAPSRWEAPLRLLGVALVITVAVLVYRPLLGVTVVDTGPAQAGRVSTRVVSTGVLPIRVRAGTGGTTSLVSGQVGTIRTRTIRAGGRIPLRAGLHLSPGWWAVLIGLCSLPLVGVLTVGLPPERSQA